MNNTYVMYSNDIVDVMTQIESFQASMTIFLEKFPHYTYDIDIKELPEDKDSKWRVDIKVKSNEESVNNTTS